MTNDVRTIQLGAAVVTVISVAYAKDEPEELAKLLGVPNHERLSRYATFFSQPYISPVASVYVTLPEIAVLVDACAIDITPESPIAPPDYQPPPGLLMRLAEIGVRPEELGHVVITHAHADHFNALTTERHGTYEPSFPNAHHYFGRADWDNPTFQQALHDPDSAESHTFGVLHRHGLLEFVDGNRDLGGGVEIIAAPGETPGHQIVRVHSEGQTLYCLGDLYHVPIEFEQPTWMAPWKQVESTLASRQALIAAALSEDAILVSAHIPGIGRLRRTESGVTFVEM